MKYRYPQTGVLDDTERIEDPLSYMEKLADSILPLKEFGFNTSARFVLATTNPTVVYDSEWCRIAFNWERWEVYRGNSIDVTYGRLHAPDGSATMKWKGEECYCWSSKMGVRPVLDFLDGLTPHESFNKKGLPRIIEETRQTDWFKNMAEKRRGPELTLRIEAKVWSHYGVRLFELFDLRRPDLWEQYRKFLKEYYDIKGRSPYIKPPLDQVC
jgi:hypothetical protein